MGERFDRVREGDVDRMHAFWGEDIDGPRKGRWGRWHKNSETPVLEFLNDECRHESLFNFGQRRFPHVFLATSHQLLGQTPKECITWDSFEKRFLDPVPSRLSYRCANSNTDQKTDK